MTKKLDLAAALGASALAIACGVALAFVDDPEARGVFMGAAGTLGTFATGALARHSGKIGGARSDGDTGPASVDGGA